MNNILQPIYLEFKHTRCALCSAVDRKFMFCSKCRVVVYCSKECQVGHWKRHKRFCKDHVWKKDNLLGTVASASCQVPTCACKHWYSDMDALLSAQTSNGYNNQPSSSTSTEPAEVQTQLPLTSDYSTNGIFSTEREFIFDLGLRVSETIDVGDTGESTYAYNLNPTYSETFNDIEGIISPNTVVYEESNCNSLFLNGSVCNEATTTTETLPQLPLPSHCQLGHPVEDLENHAPVAALTFSSRTAACETESTSQKFQHQSDQMMYSQLYSQPDNSTSGGATFHFSERTLHPANWVATVPPPSLPSSLLSLLSESSKSCVNEDNSVIESDISQGLGSPSMTHSSAIIPFQHRNNMQYISGQSAQQTRLWINQVWQEVISDLNHYGVCVVDNLLGEARGGAVLREVQNMYSKGINIQDGQLVKSKDGQSKSIRGDKITWVDGREPHCRNISVLIKLLDNIVMGANNRNNNGKLGTYTIKERSKAMVACYPGSGTHYVKHVDNPNDDGRCVTAIYYLNKDWNTQENGGLLRIFPEGWSHQVADIEPLFDRVIFFWSDRRNPHEVQPAYKTRYAITLWYFDSNAKARAKKSAEVQDISIQKTS